MFQVYISSTYFDLREFREIAAKAVRRLQCRAVAMEDYVASDERPVDRCLADVRASDVYVGLFAWRYGFVPPGHEKSITQLEYEEAGRAGIPRLIFILDETADWDDANRDADSELILQLRTDLQERHVRSAFGSGDELDAKLTAALSLELQKHGGSRKVEIPELLPYMSDRSRQRDQLADALETHRDARPRRPFVVVVHGDEREAHSAFIERLERVTFPKLLGLGTDAGLVQHYGVRWTPPGGSVDERERSLQCRLSECLTGERRADAQAMAQVIARQRCPVMVSSSVLSVDWRADEEKLVQRWLKLWAAWPDLPPGQTLIIVLSFHLKDYSRLSFWTRRGLKKKNREMCEFVAGLEPADGDAFSMVTLDRLETVREADVLSWLEDYAAKFCRESRGAISDPLVLAEQLRPWIRDLFRAVDESDQSGGIPMEQLARELRQQLNHCLNEGGT